MARKKKEDPSTWPELIIRIQINADPQKDDPIDLAGIFLNFDMSMRVPKYEKGSRIKEISWVDKG